MFSSFQSPESLLISDGKCLEATPISPQINKRPEHIVVFTSAHTSLKQCELSYLSGTTSKPCLQAFNNTSYSNPNIRSTLVNSILSFLQNQSPDSLHFTAEIEKQCKCRLEILQNKEEKSDQNYLAMLQSGSIFRTVGSSV